ncbi:DNA ligase, partial [Candidatus Beckwithbacteria bacterium CG23_combo_of_CG06-09_8_20_14_all_34_8]
TIVDALSWMQTGDKSLRQPLESAYNVRADIGQIASIFKQDGLLTIEKIIPQPGTPIRPCKATPLLDPQDILDKMADQTALEPKFDGFRVQIHVDKNRQFELDQGDLSLFSKENKVFVRIFSRNLDDTTHMFPDLVASAQNLPIESIILDGEAVAVDPKSGEILSFQETVKRKRKHDIDEVSKDIPLKAFIFDVLYLNGQSTLNLPFAQRRKMLEKIFSKQDRKQALEIAEQLVVNNLDDLQTYFSKMATQKLEGLMAKKLDSPYKAGARDFTWVKYKLGMQRDLADTVDVIVMGYFKGQGKWTQFGLGKLLVGIPVGDTIVSLSKVGSGLSEDNIVEMVKRCKAIEVSTQPKEYIVDKNLLPDVWVEPKLVIELRADSISKSPFYQTGLSLRFPRFIKFRDDKSITDATNLEELKIIAGV